MSKSQVSRTAGARVKLHQPTEVFTPEELQRLCAVFVQAKTEVLEDDLVVLITWAQQMRMGAVVLDMVFKGDLVPVVDEGVVKIRLKKRRN
jgi:hypothetical protein